MTFGQRNISPCKIISVLFLFGCDLVMSVPKLPQTSAETIVVAPHQEAYGRPGIPFMLLHSYHISLLFILTPQ